VCTQYVGGNVPSRKRTDTLDAYDFLLSWRAPNSSEDLFTWESELAWQLANPPTFPTSYGNITTTNTTLMNTATTLCAPLLPGSPLVTQCAQFLPKGDFHLACMDDVIGMQLFTVAASMINGYAAKCALYAGSAATPIVLPTSGVNSIAYGSGLTSPVTLSTPQTFIIAAKTALGQNVTIGGDTFAVSSSGPAALAFTINDLKNGLYSVLYTPTIAGTYSISILLGGVDAIANSPFAVTVVSAATDPAQSTASGSGLGLALDSGTTYTVTIQSRISTGAPRTVGGDTVSVTITGFVFPNPIAVTDNKDGTYTFTYQQEDVTSYTITITINGVQISGSPFQCATDD
jgi:hypothetical protein